MRQLGASLLLGSALSAFVVTAASAQVAAPSVQEAVVSVDTPAGALSRALITLADQAKVKIFFPTELVAGRTVPALKGRFTTRQALDQLLRGANLTVQSAGPGVLVLQRASHDAPVTPTSAVRAKNLVGQESAPSPLKPQRTITETETTQVSEIVVGSHIRGVKDGPSPVVVLSRDELDRAGYATVADALTAQPQAFGGTTSDDTGSTGADPTTTNGSKATGINLRGLGADATLVLINGRRMAGAGLMGDFADTSAIPMAAVARIEVLLDGASALYGSDAVGGVVNVVLRDRFEGAETRLRIGGSTRGDLGQRQIAQTYGRDWSTGSLLLSAEYQRRDMLAGSRRSFTANADLRALGGTDHRTYYGGTILTIDPVSFSLVPTYAIPAGQAGVALKPSDFVAGTQNMLNYRQPMTLLPTQERGSLYIALNQEIGSRITLTADARYSDRRYTAFGIASQTALTVTKANPYFVSPTGASSHYIAYSFANEAGGLKSTGDVQSRGLSIGAKIDLPAQWRLDAYALHAEELALTRSTNELNTGYLNEALGNTADNPATAYKASVDGYFNPFIGAGRNTQSVLDFVMSGFEERRTVGRLETISATADGPLWQLPAGAVRLALGAQLRTETLKTIGINVTNGVAPQTGFSRYGDRTVSALFVEARAPLFGESFHRPGLERVDLSAALRREHYEGGETSTVPKLGLVWGPTRALNIKATYGKSFRAPSLGELTDPQRVTPVNVAAGNGTTLLTLLKYGGNPDLLPERATSWTSGIEYASPDHPELRLSATYFDTNFKQRIGQPAIANLSTVLTAPDLSPFRQYIDPINNPTDLALIKSLLTLGSASVQGLYPAAAYRAIADARYVNTGAFRVRGVDFNGTWGTTAFGDPLTVTGSVSWLLSYQRKTTQAAQAVELAGTAEYPADLRGRLGATWTHGAWAVTGAANYVSRLTTSTGDHVSAQTTFDAALQWTIPAKAGALKGVVAAVTVQNLFDKDPPFYDSPVGVGYDPANYEPNGRVVALQLTKAW